MGLAAVKALKIAGIVVGAVALAATGVGLIAGAGTALAATAATVATVATIASAAINVAGALASPKFSQQGTPTTFQTNPQSGLPYAMGRTRMSGVRIFAETNTRPGYTKFDDLLWFGVLLSAGGAIEAIEGFTGDNVPYYFNASTGQVSGDLANYMAQKVHLGGPQSSAIALSLMGGAAPGWTTQHRLSGMAHAMWALRFDKDGEKLASGVPEPAWIGRWVKVYDPRKDSTYPGGSGSHRVLDESTYEWSENGALHALTWALGRWQNGKRTLGIGAPVANIRFNDFVEAANVADANQWKCGGVEWSTDSKWDILQRMLQSAGAERTMTGAMIGCRVNAPRVPIATISSSQLLDRLSISTTKSRRERFNTVIPRFRDEESDWEIVSGTPVSVPAYVAADGGQRTKEIDFPLVQRASGWPATQAGQLAAYEIVNSREAGPIVFTTGPQWIGLKSGDCVTLDVPEEGLAGQTVLIKEVSLDPATAKVTFTAETETSSKHAFALGQSTTPPPPFTLTPPDLTPPPPNPAIWSLTATTVGLGYPAIAVAGASEFPGADSVLIRYRVVGSADWQDAGKVAAAGNIRRVITPVAGGVPYEAGVAYQSEERVGPYTNLGPVTAPNDGLAILIADAIATGDNARGVWWQENPPSANETEPNDLWIRKSDGRTYIRISGSGRISLGARRIALAGSAISLPWVETSDQRIGAALLAAAGAQAVADGKAEVFTMFGASDPVPVGVGIGDLLIRAYLDPAQVDHWNGTDWITAATYGATAEQAGIIEAIASDGVLSRGEKPAVILAFNALNSDYVQQRAQAVAYGLAVTQVAAADAAMDLLVAYLLGLSPAWDDASSDTPIVPLTYQDRWNDAYSAVAELAAAISGRLADDVTDAIIPGGGGIAPGKVNTPAIVNNAVTESAQAVSGSMQIGAGMAVWRVLAEYYVDMEYAGEIQAWAKIGQIFNSGPRQWEVQLRVNGGAVDSTGGENNQVGVPLAGKASVGVGTFSIAVWAAAIDGTVRWPAGSTSLLSLRSYR